MLIKNVTLIDGTGAVRENMSIEVRGGKIWDIGPDLELKRGEKLIDESGMFVIPGLIDTRVQIGASPGSQIYRAEVGQEQRTAWLHAMLGLGITTARLIQGDLEEHRFFKHWRQLDLQNSPTLMISGPTFTAPDGSPTDQYPRLALALRQREVAEVANEDDAREKSRTVAHNEGDIFEVVYSTGSQAGPSPRLSDQALATIIREAHGHDLRVFCWVGHDEEARKAVASGCDVLQGASEELLSDEVLKEMATKNIAYMPSLLYQGYLVNHQLQPADLKAYLADPLVANSLSPIMKKSLEAERGQLATLRKLLTVRAGASEKEVAEALYGIPDDSPPETRPKPDGKQITVADMFARQEQRALQNLHRAKAAGVRIVVGTGAGSILDFPGSSLHLEMRFLVENGFTPAEALQAATSNAAFALGKDSEIGILAKDKTADFVILEANPLADIRNAAKVKAVVRGGRLVQPGDLDNY